MLETAIVAFTTFFATIGQVSVSVIYAVMTHDSKADMKQSMAIRGCIIASYILISFSLEVQFMFNGLSQSGLLH